ncbi:VCBS repeat-containing protein, partial [Myxococcota bacterium]|nr:VCBS repeat-containing protein [Myxococcota bacterium]
LQISNNVNLTNGLRYPAVADLDRDGNVEMCTGHTMFRYNSATNLWDTVWSIGTGRFFTAYADFGTYPLDPAGDDRKIKDGTAEIVVVAGGTAWVINVHGRTIFGPVAFPAGSGGGPPTAGDFDGDGRVEFSAASSDSISVFDPDCWGIPDVSTCLSLRTDGILWHQVSQDHSSNQTGSSLFDFEGDGRVEVVYADETFTRVYDGRTGEVLFSQWHSSCTWNENPIVADVDGDFNAELVVPSNLNCTITPSTAGGVAYPTSHLGNPMDPLYKGFRCEEATDCASGVCDMNFCRCVDDAECGGSGSGYVCDVPVPGTPGTGNVCRSEWLGSYPGIRVYADALDRWVSSRTIWNQHTYSVTNVSEAGIVPPLTSWEQNWTNPHLNNFRQNVQGSVDAGTAPDVTPKGSMFDCTIEAHAEFAVEICNRGTQPLPANLPYTAYEEITLAPLCTVGTTVTLAPGQCQLLSCEWDTPPSSPSAAVNVLIMADDDGTGASSTLECLESNNSAVITDVYCEVIGK